jgi:pseudolysin
MHLKITSAVFLLLASLFSMCEQSLAAELLELRNHPSNVLQTFVSKKSLSISSSLKEINRYTDFNKTTHIRVQEYYRGYPIWNARAVMHVSHLDSIKYPLATLLSQQSQKSMNGELYFSLNKDLDKTPLSIFSKEQSQRALQFAISKYKEKIPYRKDFTINNPKSELMIFVENHRTAHWIYKVSFTVENTGKLPARPVYLIDAINFIVYKTWDDIKTDFVKGGGYGGNPLIGKLIYDGGPNQLAFFTVKRAGNECSFETDEIVVKDYKTKRPMHYPCLEQDKEHHQVYWNGNFDEVNGGYSPANDAMFAAQVLKRFYKNWYDVPVLVKDGKEMQLVMRVHYPKLDNAFWENDTMTFGDGTELYPLTSLNIAAHEVSHGFTEQHSDLTYDGQSGGMNESFSDMAAQTAEYYAYGKSNWLIGNDVIKLSGETLRYMDLPTKDCYGKEPGTFCSIDNANQYYEGLDVHFSSGVYNRAFYLLSTTPGWDPRKAFAVMLRANAAYWLSQTEYLDGAACVIKAAQDLGYDINAVKLAFERVGITVNQSCTNKDS